MRDCPCHIVIAKENTCLCRTRELISRRESRQPDRHADEATADATDTAVTGYLSPKVEGDRRSPCSGGRHSQVCMSISWSQFSSRNRARNVGLTVNCCAGAARKRALTCLVNIHDVSFWKKLLCWHKMLSCCSKRLVYFGGLKVQIIRYTFDEYWIVSRHFTLENWLTKPRSG